MRAIVKDSDVGTAGEDHALGLAVPAKAECTSFPAIEPFGNLHVLFELRPHRLRLFDIEPYLPFVILQYVFFEAFLSVTAVGADAVLVLAAMISCDLPLHFDSLSGCVVCLHRACNDIAC